MRKILYLFLLLLLYACNESTVNEIVKENNSANADYTNVSFSFDSVTNPTVWKRFQNLEEMQAACQIPQKVLEKMSTDNLIQACMNYPLYAIYAAYNNEMDGIKVITDNFNGFKELQKRKNAAEKLIDYYNNINIDRIVNIVSTRSTFQTKDEISVLHIGYIELILASKFIPAVYSESNISRLENVMNNKYKAKLQHTNIFSIQTVKKSLLLGAQIKLSSQKINSDDRVLLSRFVKSGGTVSKPELYTKISQIIYDNK